MTTSSLRTSVPEASPRSASALDSLATRYGGSVPRYTSYPTAPHFSPGLTDSQYAAWLSEIGPGADLSLYLHIPFCKEMCWYCGCFTKITNRYAPIAGYVDHLIGEIDLVAGHLGGRTNARFIHWGGGSPTILKAVDWQRIFEHLQRHFDIPDDADIAVEMDPRTTTQDYVDVLARLGVNRVSIGVQEFDETIQRAINRLQPYDVTARVVDMIGNAGIKNLNLDLMYGLPMQTLGHVEDMTIKALGFRPTRIALFGYAHVPWMKTHQKMIPDADLPGIEARWQQAARAAEILVAAGYVRIGFDHFALPDDPIAAQADSSVARNFQGYTTDTAENLIGFGASAISALQQGYAQNAASMPSYAAAVTSGRLPIARGIALSADDRLRRFVIEKIMCDMAVDVGQACQRHGMAVASLDQALENLQPMIDDGLLEITGRRVTVHENGRVWVRNIAAAFDAYLGQGKARHSSAV